MSTLLNKLNFYFQFGIELEFYIEKIKKDNLFLDEIKKITKLGFSCKKEISKNQFEIKSKLYTKSDKLIKNFKLVKNLIIKTARKLGGNASFKAKPYLNKAGSALNVHINLIDLKNKNNLFYCKERKYSDLLLYSIGGLCSVMKKDMIFFAPNNNSYLRFKYPNIYTPTTVSWGVNNRTTAIRVINTIYENCRLEHRIPGSDCDIEKIIKVITEGIIFGIQNKISPPKRVYGVASNPQYKMESLL